MTYVTIQEKFWLELFEYNKLIIKLVTRTNKEKESNLRNKLVFGLAFFCLMKRRDIKSKNKVKPKHLKRKKKTE